MHIPQPTSITSSCKANFNKPWLCVSFTPHVTRLQEFVTPFFFQSKVLVWTCIGLNSKTRRFWQLAELQKQPCTSTNYPSFMIPVLLRRDGAQFLLFAAFIGSITWRHKLLPPFAFWFINTPEPGTRLDNIHETGQHMPNAPTVHCC